jgi:16S rRNA (cytosine1402-N4)-methyltransferase
MRKLAKPDDLPRHLPIRAADFHPQFQLIGKAIMPSEEEVKGNIRARSAVLRIAEKLR